MVIKKIAFRIKNVLQSMPYLITLFFICIGAIALFFYFTGFDFKTPIMTIVSTLIFITIIAVDIYMLDNIKIGESPLSLTTIVLFITLIIVLFPFALIYSVGKGVLQKDKSNILPEMEKEYPEKVDIIVRELNPKAYSCT